MSDSTIDRVREVRRSISAEIGSDLSKMVDRYAEMESRFALTALTSQGQQPSSHEAAATPVSAQLPGSDRQ